MSGKSATLKKAQDKVKELEKLKQEIRGRMPKKTNFMTKPLVDLLEKQLDNLEEKLKEAKKALEEATNASDLVDMDVLDKVKDVVEDIADGKTDDLIEDVKDFGQEKIEDIIDKNIKDGGIADRVKDVVEEVIDGDIDGAIDKIKDGAEEIIKDKVEDLVDDLLAKVEDQVKEKLVGLLRKQVGGLTDKALDKVRQQGGGEGLVGQLLSNIVKRIEKEAPAFIEKELQKLIKKDGLKVLLGMAKNAAIEVLKDGLKGRKLGEILKSILDNIVKSPEFKEIYRGLKRRLLRKLIQIVEDELEQTFGPAIDTYLNQYGNWSGSLLDTGKRAIHIGPFWGCVSVALSLQANLTASLVSKRKGLGVSAQGSVSGKAYAGIGIVLGFDLPVVGGVSIEGGVQGGPELLGKAQINFAVENAILKGKMESTTLNIDMSARLYLETGIPNNILSYIPQFVAGITVSGSTLYYGLGRINALTCKTPSYKLTFDVVKGKYAYMGAVGKYNITLNPRVKEYIKETKEAIEDAAQAALDAINPTTWDLNPFDEEGWIGSWF